LPLIFNEQQANYDNEDQAQLILQALIDLNNIINTQVVMAEVCLPDKVDLNLAGLENLGEDSVLGQWSMGFLVGHNWLGELW